MNQHEIELAGYRSLVAVLKRHTDTGVATIGQVLFYEDETVLLIGLLTLDATKRVRDVTEDDDNLLELSPV